MKIAILGYGKEGKSVENYFKEKSSEIKIFDGFTNEGLEKLDLNGFDMVFRSPSVKPLDSSWTSITKYFFDNCICPIIGVTGTKGKGTTCSMITAILESLGKTVHLVGNIGNPALDILDKIQPEDIVVYEMSSFQLWDLSVSPKISVVLRIEPDHLNVHKDFEDYKNAKSHIAEFQAESDSCIFFKDNENSVEIAEKSAGKKFPYPLEGKSELLKEVLNSLTVPGDHNKENAEAALLAVSAFFELPLEKFLEENKSAIKSALSSFKGLPHHIEFIRELNGVKYYDDSFSASFPSLDAALKSFPENKIVLIAGGKDRNLDLNPAKRVIFDNKNLEKAVLIGETKELLSSKENPDKFILCDTLESAVGTAQEIAENTENSIVLLSPGAASFDMFKDFYDRGEKFQALVKGLN